MSCREARYTRFYLDFFKFNEDEAHETPVLTVPPVGSPSTKVVSLDDILGADLVNKENIVKQPLAKQTRGVCASSSPFPFVEKMEHLFFLWCSEARDRQRHAGAPSWGDYTEPTTAHS